MMLRLSKSRVTSSELCMRVISCEKSAGYELRIESLMHMLEKVYDLRVENLQYELKQICEVTKYIDKNLGIWIFNADY